MPLLASEAGLGKGIERERERERELRDGELERKKELRDGEPQSFVKRQGPMLPVR